MAAFAIISKNDNPTTPPHPFCKECGWRKGGRDSWNGSACKCGHGEPPILELDEINPHLGLLLSESHVSDRDREWERFVRKIEKKLGHAIDGNQATDGYCLDYAHDYFVNCDTVDEYVADVRAAIAEIDAAFGPRVSPTPAPFQIKTS